MSNKSKKSFIWDDVLEDESLEKEIPEEEIKDDFQQFNKYGADKPKAKVASTEIEEDNDEDIEYYSDIPTKTKIFSRNRLLLSILLLILLCMYFVPVFKVSKVTMNETSFITKKQMLKSLEITEGNRYSLYKMNTLKHNLDEESVTASQSKYNIPQRTLTVNVDEITPLAKNSDNELYYEQNGSVLTSTEVNYYVPTIEGLSDEQEKSILNELKELDYNIIKEMSLITSAQDDKRKNLVYIEMKDGNYIEIGINQIATKMQYYMQMQKVIDQKAKGKKGILHLNIGDYYEPL